jgi:hypothetical protein
MKHALTAQAAAFPAPKDVKWCFKRRRQYIKKRDEKSIPPFENLDILK